MNDNGTKFDNEITYWGPDVSFGHQSVEVTAQYLFRKDTNPFLSANPEDLETTGMVVEVLYAPDIERSRSYFTGLYNLIDSEYYKYETITASYTYVLGRNLRLLAEYTRDLEGKHNRLVGGVVAAF